MLRGTETGSFDKKVMKRAETGRTVDHSLSVLGGQGPGFDRKWQKERKGAERDGKRGRHSAQRSHSFLN